MNSKANADEVSRASDGSLDCSTHPEYVRIQWQSLLRSLIARLVLIDEHMSEHLLSVNEPLSLAMHEAAALANSLAERADKVPLNVTRL